MAAMKRILLFPDTNTLSHLTQALAVADWLEADGFECHLGVSHARMAWATRFFPRCHPVSELWDRSGVPFPCLGWFSDRPHIERCLCSQEALLRQLKPAMVIGIFDFLSSASVRDIPLLGINGFCMLPLYRGVLGYDDRDSPARREQARTLDRFWTYAARAVTPSLQRRNRPAPVHATEMLVGDFNFIYEIPEFWGAPALPAGYAMIGPVFWDGWDRIGTVPPAAGDDARPIVLLNSGTLPSASTETRRTLVSELLRRGARVWVNTGEEGGSEVADRLLCQPFFSPRAILGRTDLVLCTGGTGACHQNLAHAVPSLVLPMQPEQATNGIRLEQLRCGRVLAPSIVFTGRPTEYARTVDCGHVVRIVDEMLEGRAEYRPPLERMAAALQGYSARASICRLAKRLL